MASALRDHRLPMLTAAVLLLAGCQTSTPTDLTLTGADVVGLPMAVSPVLRSGSEQTVALYHLRIDGETLTAEAANLTQRAAQASPQAKAYDLELWGAITDPQGNPFLTIRGTKQFEIVGLTNIPNLGLQVTFRHAHPLPAPNYQQSTLHTLVACADCLCYSDVPPSSQRPSNRQECFRAREFGAFRPNAVNRSDLSYSGRAVFLTNVPADSRTFFGDLRVDTGGVITADGYLDVRSIINAPGDQRHPGLTNTVFPYVLLADELKNNREGRSNGGQPTGNYDAATGGWQRSNIGTEYSGWTGYDVLHAGQAVTNSVILKQAPGGGYEGYVALVVKYTDPRGKSSVYWRWPTPTPDPLQFAYRLPFAALDASVVMPPADPVAVGQTAGATAFFTVGVRDWDRTAPPHSSPDLSSVTDVTLVQPAGPGTCTVTLDVPGLMESPVSAVYLSGSGLPGSECRFRAAVTNVTGTAALGPQLGLVRVVDPEAADAAAGDYRYGINNPPGYTNASGANALPVVTYQLVRFEVVDPRPRILSVDPSGCPTPVAGKSGNGTNFIATATNAPTSWSWNFGGGATPNTSSQSEPFVTFGAAGTYTGTVTATNAAGASVPYAFCFVVSP